MSKKMIGFVCVIAACSVLTACSGQEAAPTAASVSQSAAASESVSVSESVSSVAESVSSVAESASSSSGDGTDLTTEYNPEGTAKEFTAEEASIYGDIEALHERQYQDLYNNLLKAGLSEEEAEKMARETIDETSAAHEALLESNEQYLAQVEEDIKQRQEEFDKEFEETYGMSPEEFDNLTWQEQSELRGKLVDEGKLPKGGVG